MSLNSKEKPTLINRFLNIVEKVGNRLPDPSILFFFNVLRSRRINLDYFIFLYHG